MVVDWQGWTLDAATAFAAVRLLFPAMVTLLTFEANRRMGPNVAGSLGNLAPLFAVGIALGEHPSPMQGVGVAVIFIGVTMLSVTKSQTVSAWPI